MTWLYIYAAVYLVAIALFAYYACLEFKQAKRIQEWNDATREEIKGMRNKQVDYEERLKRYEAFMATFDIIESEGDLKVKGRTDGNKV